MFRSSGRFRPPGAEPRDLRRRLAALAIAAGAVGVACSTLGAAWQASAANGEWQDAVRAQNRVSARTIEITRNLYQGEAPQAFDLAVLTVQAEELERRARSAEPGSAVRGQAAALRGTADALTNEFAETHGMAATNELVANPAYRTADGGFDVLHRLRDMQAKEWVPGDDPNRPTAAGDAFAGSARAWTVGMLLSLLAAVAGVVAWYRLRADEPEAGDAPEVGLGAPAPPAAPADSGDGTPARTRRVIAGLALVFGALATVFTAAQIRAGLEENQAFAAAGRHAAQVSATAAGGGIRQSFRDGAKFEVSLLERRATEQAGEPGAGAALLAAADAATAARLDGIIRGMAQSPRRGDDLAEPLRAVASATLADAYAALGEEHEGVDAAERAGTRSNTMVVALFAITVAACLLDVAAAAGARTRPRYLRTAIACAALALVIAAVPTLS